MKPVPWERKFMLDVGSGRPCMYVGVPDDTYHRRWPGISNSQLKHLSRSPAHYAAYLEAKRGVQETPALIVGRALHTAVLEPDKFDSRFVERPPGHGASKAYKEAVAQIKERRPDIRILSAKDIKMVREMAAAVRAHPTAGPLVKTCYPEVSALWKDDDTDVLCRGRADIWSPKINMLADIKTTADGRLEMFRSQIYNYRYYVQAAFYLKGWHILGHEDVAFAFIAIEKEPPYAVALYELDPAWLLWAKTEIAALLDVYVACKEADHWPAYDEHVQPVMPSRWQDQALENVLDRLGRLEETIKQKGKVKNG